MKSRILELDGLRGIAALAVFFIHSGGFGLKSFGNLGYAIVDHGKYGVTLFFVVSAFCLCLSVAPAFAKRPIDWRAFYIRRFARILPLFFAVCAFLAVVNSLNGTWKNIPIDTLLRIGFNHITLLSMFDPTTNNAIIGVEWSIFVEFLFYFMFPFVLFWLIAAPWSMVVVTAVLMWPPVCKIITDFLGINEPNFTIFWHFHSFLVGMLVYRFLIADPTKRPVLGSALFIAAITLSIAAVFKQDHGFSVSAASLAAAFTIAAAHYASPLVGWLRWPFLVFIGGISFSIYLIHPLVMRPMGGLGSLFVYQAVAALAATIAIAWGTNRMIELPAQDFGRRMIANLRVRAAAPESAR